MTQNLNIEIENISVELPNGKKLFAIPHYKIPQGHHLLIQGESGKGKTTFLHLLAGLFLPQSGHVKIGDAQLSALNDNERADLRRNKIGVIFQKLNLLDHLTAAENIQLSAGEYENALKKVRLEQKAQELCSYLSLGEQQRVAVARVLAQSPEIILADEPTSSLDETNAKFVMQALKEIARGKTLIVVSHDHRIANYFDEVVQFEQVIQ